MDIEKTIDLIARKCKENNIKKIKYSDDNIHLDIDFDFVPEITIGNSSGVVNSEQQIKDVIYKKYGGKKL